MFVTFVLGISDEDIATYMNANSAQVLGQPIFITDLSKLQGVDQMDPHYIFLKTPEYWQAENVNDREIALLRMKRKNYAGPIFFVTIDGIIIPCMRFQMQMTSLPPSEIEDWPAEVEHTMVCQVTLTTAIGQKYTVYSGNVNLLNFCGTNKALVISQPLTFTGGFA